MTTAIKLSDIGLTRDQWHRYTWRGAEPLKAVTLASVSNIVGLQESLSGTGGLVKWGAGLAADYVIDQWTDATQQWAAGKDVPVVTAREVLRNTAIAQTDGPAGIGSAVHEQVRRMLHGEQITPDETTVYHVAQFGRFLAAERPEVFFAEEMVANLALGYGGQFDFFAELRGKHGLVDVKTGKLKPTHRLQLGLYGDAEFIGRSGSTETIPMPETEAAWVLLLRADGYDLIDMTPTEADIEHGRFLATVYGKLKAWQRAQKEGGE